MTIYNTFRFIFCKPILLFFLVSSSPGILVQIAKSEQTELPIQPKICIGYHPEAKHWGLVGSVDEQQPEYCPPNFAYFAAVSASSNVKDPATIPVLGACCPLPVGILINEHKYVSSECPENHVATGGTRLVKKNNRSAWESADHYLRCTAINSKRFQLGTETPALDYGWATEWLNDKIYQVIGQEKIHINRNIIPVAIRYGILRSSWTSWTNSSCLGYPWGSLLVKKTSKICSGFIFRELQYRGRDGDPPQGTAVNVFPNCKSISDPLDSDASCIN